MHYHVLWKMKEKYIYEMALPRKYLQTLACAVLLFSSLSFVFLANVANLIFGANLVNIFFDTLCFPLEVFTSDVTFEQTTFHCTFAFGFSKCCWIKISQKLESVEFSWVAWMKKGLWQPEEDFFFVGFFFSSLSGTLRSMTIKRHGHLYPTRVTSSQLAISTATYTSECDSTSGGRHNLRHGNINFT